MAKKEEPAEASLFSGAGRLLLLRRLRRLRIAALPAPPPALGAATRLLATALIGDVRNTPSAAISHLDPSFSSYRPLPAGTGPTAGRTQFVTVAAASDGVLSRPYDQRFAWLLLREVGGPGGNPGRHPFMRRGRRPGATSTERLPETREHSSGQRGAPPSPTTELEAERDPRSRLRRRLPNPGVPSETTCLAYFAKTLLLPTTGDPSLLAMAPKFLLPPKQQSLQGINVVSQIFRDAVEVLRCHRSHRASSS